MAFHTFKHPDFASKYRLSRIITQDLSKSPKVDFVLDATFANETELRLVFQMNDANWTEAKELLAKQEYFVFSSGSVVSILPD